MALQNKFFLLLFALSVSGPLQAETLKIGIESGVKGFDPIKANVMGVSTLTVAHALFDTLITLDEKGEIVPALATSLKPVNDGAAWVATLRKDVSFHDGTSFNAEAVAFHFERLLNPDNKCPCRGVLRLLKSVEVVDEYSVKFNLEGAWAALPALLAEPSVVSMIGSPAAISSRDHDYHRNPVGTGPFRFKSWESGHRIIVDRVNNHWSGIPASNIDQVEYHVLPDQQTRFAAIRSGDVDLVWTMDAPSVFKARKQGRFRVVERTGAGARLLLLNLKAKHLSDARVRRALAYAVDLDAYAQHLYKGLTPKATDPFGSGGFIQCGDDDYPVYDLAKARALLKDYGKPVNLTFTHTATPRGRKTAQIFQYFWKQAGIDVILEPVSQGALLSKMLKRNYEIGAWRFRDSRDPDADLFALFHSKSPFNVVSYNSPELDDLIQQAGAEQDKEVRQKYYCQIADKIAYDLPSLYLVQNSYYVIARLEVLGDMELLGGLIDVRNLSLEKI